LPKDVLERARQEQDRTVKAGWEKMNQKPNRAEYCLQQAAECDKKAKTASNRKAKEVYWDLAKQWRELAKQLERLDK